MRQTAYILILIFVSGFLEINAQKIDTSNVYYQALRLHLDYLDSYNEKRPKAASLITHYLVEQNDYITDSLPKTINDFTIEILTRKDIYERTKKKRSIHMIALRPAIWENGRLVINVIDYGVSRKGKHFNYTNVGGSSFQVISASGERLKLKIIHQGGI